MNEREREKREKFTHLTKIPWMGRAVERKISVSLASLHVGVPAPCRDGEQPHDTPLCSGLRGNAVQVCACVCCGKLGTFTTYNVASDHDVLVTHARDKAKVKG